MDYLTPDSGSTSYQTMCWGHARWDGGNDIPDLPNLDQAPEGNTADGIPISQTPFPNLPSDTFSSIQCLHDIDTYYYTSPYAPSPYLTDGSRNLGYYQTISPLSINNCLADFDGKGNSEILWGLATAQSDWKTASTITNRAIDNCLPAACCCWRYHTDGTQQGDWYLPACGELGYMMPMLNKINKSITNVLNTFGSSMGIKLRTNGYYYYWTSSEYSDKYARRIDMLNGRVNTYDKYSDFYVRAFLKVNDSMVQ